jgi:hypothetical protein
VPAHDGEVKPAGHGGKEFTVGAVLHNVVGRGRLVVAPEILELHIGPVIRRISHVESVRHRGSDVEMYRARLVPPWMSCSVVVSDGERTVLATLPIWMRRKVRKALNEAGFHTTEKVTLVERGWERLTFDQ